MTAYTELVLKYNAAEGRGAKGSPNGGKFVAGRQTAPGTSGDSGKGGGRRAPAGEHSGSRISSAGDKSVDHSIPKSHLASAHAHRAKADAANLEKPGKPLGKSIRIRVVHGDTLWGIARKYGTTVNAVLDANPALKDRPGHTIFAGTPLTIPAGPAAHAHGSTHHAHAHKGVAHTHKRKRNKNSSHKGSHHKHPGAHHKESAATRAKRAADRAKRKAEGIKTHRRSHKVKKSYAELVGMGPYEVMKRKFDASERKSAAESGAAMPHGEFPIETKADLHNAMQAIGRAKDPSAAKAHIKERAKALGLEDELTPAFKSLEEQDETAIVSVFKSMEESRYSLGLAYPADKLDGHKEFMTRDTVEKTAWRWLKDHRQIGLAHMDGTVGHGTVVESYIYRGPDWEIVGADGKQQVIKSGDWLLGAVWDRLAWPLVKSGQFDGWSMQGVSGRRKMPRAQAGI